MKLRLIMMFFLASSLAALTALADEPVRIVIKSSWVGMASSTNNSIMITGKNGRYTAEGNRANSKAVMELLEALEAPVMQQPSLDQCGISEKWLNDNYIGGLKEYTHHRINELSPKQVDLFRLHFITLSSADAAFAELFKGWHTDDYPKVSVTIKDGDRQYGVQSESQNAFMLPWIGSDRPRGGYSCKISRAIAALIPHDFPNRDRLVLGAGFRWKLTEKTMDLIRDEWDLLGTEFKVGPAVAPVFARFTPVKSAISNLSSIDLDGRESWNAELRSPDLPANFVIGVSLLYSKKELKGVDALLTQVPQYAKLVLSVPWLQKYLQDHPDTKIELRYVNGHSLSPKALASLAEDLRKHGKTELADIVSRQAEESAFIEINSGTSSNSLGCWSRAIVLPSGVVLLWHFQCDSVLGFPAKDFSVWDFYGWRSTGTVIDTDGTIKK